MKFKVLSRYVLYGNNILMHQRRRYFLCIKFLSWWADWYPLNNQLHQKDQAIVKHVEKLKSLLQDRDDIESHLKEQIKSLSGRHESETFYVKTDEFWYRKHPTLQPVDGSWRGVLNAKLFKRGTPGVQQTIRERVKAPERPLNSSGLTAYGLKEFEHFSGVIDSEGNFDNYITYKEPQTQKSSSGKNQNPKNRRKGESDQEYKERLASLEGGS